MLAVAIVWIAGGLYDALWSYRFWRVDPWHLDGPVQWPIHGRHAERLEQELTAMTGCLPDNSLIALDAPESWGDQRFYLFMWMAFLLPEHRLIPMHDPSARNRAERLLSFHGDLDPLPKPAGFEPMAGCSSPWLVTYQPTDSAR